MDDLIFRAEAIEACNQQTTDCNPDHFNGHEHFTEFLDDATIGSFGKWQFANGFNVGVMAARIAIKNIDPAQRWIPVTEPPEEDGNYLCYLTVYGHPKARYRAVCYYDAEDGFCEDGTYTNRVTHWMPLPEPPKEEP